MASGSEIMEKIMPKRKQYAKEVEDFIESLGITRMVDRTQQKHRYKFDVDIRKPSAKNGKNVWIYWGSHRDIEKAREKIQENVKSSLGSGGEARIVEAKTGLVLEIWK